MTNWCFSGEQTHQLGQASIWHPSSNHVSSLSAVSLKLERNVQPALLLVINECLLSNPRDYKERLILQHRKTEKYYLQEQQYRCLSVCLPVCLLCDSAVIQAWTLCSHINSCFAVRQFESTEQGTVSDRGKPCLDLPAQPKQPSFYSLFRSFFVPLCYSYLLVCSPFFLTLCLPLYLKPLLILVFHDSGFILPSPHLLSVFP